jgi:hypothetical protein
MTIHDLIRGLDRMRDVALDGAAQGLDPEADRITGEMQQSPAHGDVTGATHASYNARRVGRGATGAAAHAAAVAAVEGLNPGHAASAGVTVAGIGVIIDSATDYQERLETENAGDKAVLGPTIGAEGLSLTAAAAAGSKKALGG